MYEIQAARNCVDLQGAALPCKTGSGTCSNLQAGCRLLLSVVHQFHSSKARQAELSNPGVPWKEKAEEGVQERHQKGGSIWKET